ncbi:hypothetical protein EV421DRAFT_1741716 [Armillaria borealis]|uniref:Uncharacterized protein n=1 Tax=Armillaria borealis TaxID=47425 RepID=A0AA39J1U1_9AGAR|nr:hypothetical protein EV421DRAFT_1741716 [Armillaria borealis]
MAMLGLVVPLAVHGPRKLSKFIATGAMMPALAVPLAPPEVHPVFGFTVQVLMHVVPAYVSLLCGLAIIIAWFSKGGVDRKHLPYSQALSDCEQAFMGIKRMYRQRMALYDSNITPPDCHLAPSLSFNEVSKALLLGTRTFSKPTTLICNVTISGDPFEYTIVLTRVYFLSRISDTITSHSSIS